jgi:ribosomal protein S18 acetylase RimI-like enzyme
MDKGKAMFSEPRHYRDERDLDAMRSLLRAGRRAKNGTYYVHTGDINWWLYYPSFGVDLFEHLYVWDDPSRPGRLLAWVLLGYDSYSTFDVVVQPELRGTPLALEMVSWAEQRMTGILRSLGKDTIRMMWIFEDDTVMDAILRQRGFQRHNEYVHLVRSLDEPIQVSAPPQGWKVRTCRGLEEVETRAAAQHGAFGSSAPMEQYVGRFKRFMQSGVYNSEWEFVAANEAGKIGAFCITWPDPLNRVGLFEPVGTHPDFQRQGLGKALLLEALRRLRENGMRQAIVSTEEDNQPGIKLYESAGFRIVNRLMTYQKKFAN